MTAYVLDASALLALILGEKGAERVEEVMDESAISTVNVSEVGARLLDLGADPMVVWTRIEQTRLDIRPFDFTQAKRAAQLRVDTRRAGLSLGDRACLALAASRSATALTSDRAWQNLSLPVAVELIR